MNRSRWYWLLGSILLLLLLALGLIWRLPDPRLVHTFSVNTLVNEVAMSPDGSYIAASERNKYGRAPRISVWRTHDKERLFTVSLNCHATVMKMSPDSQYLLVATKDRALALWELEVGASVRYLIDPQPPYQGEDSCNGLSAPPIYDLAFHPEGDLIAVAHPDGIILLIDRHFGMLVHELQGHWNATYETYREVRDVAFSSDGRLLASVGTDGSSHIWDVNDGELIHILHPNHPGTPSDVVFSSGNQEIALFRQFALVERWDLSTETLLYRDGLPAPPDRAVTFNVDGTIVAVGGFARDSNPAAFLDFNPTIYLCSVKHPDDCEALRGHTDVISELDLSSERQLLVSGSHDGTVRLWRVPEFEE
jgi:WD40 repeat protein